MGCVSAKNLKEDVDNSMPQEADNSDETVEKIRLKTRESVQMWTEELHPSDVLNFCDKLDEVFTSEDAFNHQKMTIVEQSLTVAGRKIRRAKIADTYNGFHDGKVKEINYVNETWESNGRRFTKWNETAYSKFWRMDRIVDRGQRVLPQILEKNVEPRVDGKEVEQDYRTLPSQRFERLLKQKPKIDSS